MPEAPLPGKLPRVLRGRVFAFLVLAVLAVGSLWAVRGHRSPAPAPASSAQSPVSAPSASAEENEIPRMEEGSAGLVVTVTDRADRASIGAEVLVAGPGLASPRSAVAGERGETGIDRIRPGIYALRATRGDEVTPDEIAITLADGDSKKVAVQLVAGRRLLVAVKDEATDRPVPAANVTVSEHGLSSFPLEANTDEQGRATIGPIAPGSAAAAVRAEGFIARSGIAVPAGLSPKLVISLAHGAVLRGEVVDERGRPIVGATIEIVGLDRDGMPIDERGGLIEERAAGIAAARLVRGAGTALQGAGWDPGLGDLGVMKGPVPPIPHGEVPLPALLPAVAAPIDDRASVPDAAGISTSAASADRGVFTTDEHGAFRSGLLPPGKVRVLARHPDYTNGSSELTALEPSAKAFVRVALSQGAALSGRVLDPRHEPIAGASVAATGVDAKLERRATTDSFGRFDLTGLPSHVLLTVQRSSADEPAAYAASRALTPGRRTDVEIVLAPPRGPLRITARDDRGNPLDGVQLQLASLDPDVHWQRTRFTRRDGAVDVPGVAGLAVRLIASHPSRATVVEELSAAPSDLAITLGNGFALTGSVTTRGGRNPLRGADVTLSSLSARAVRRTRTGRDGSYRFERVPRGPLRITVAHDGFAAESRDIAEETAGNDDGRALAVPSIDLTEEARIEGEVRDERGEPVARAVVRGWPAAAAEPADWIETITDGRGGFRLAKVGEGELRIVARAADGATGAATVAAQAGRGTDVTVSVSHDPAAAGRDESSCRASLLGARLVRPCGEGADKSAGWTVVGVDSSSDAEAAGLIAGDRIAAIGGRLREEPSEIEGAAPQRPGESVIVEVVRGADRAHLLLARGAAR